VEAAGEQGAGCGKQLEAPRQGNALLLEGAFGAHLG
jgi:hypothetical protein